MFGAASVASTTMPGPLAVWRNCPGTCMACSGIALDLQPLADARASSAGGIGNVGLAADHV
jgi:hypothetical protein